MTEEVLASYDPSSDNAALAERGAPEGEKELRFGAMAAVQSGVLVSQDDRVHLVVLPSGGTASTTDLHDLGDIRHFARARDVIVASGARGFAAFDAATGAFRWKRTVFRSRVSVVPLALHDLPGLVREDEPFREEVPVGEGESHPVNVYWTLPDAGWIVAPGHNGTLVGISLDDGAVIWELPAEGQVAVDASPASPAAVVIGRGEIRIYPIPRGPTLE
jgi:outer membrane protein assembly factor BamB